MQKPEIKKLGKVSVQNKAKTHWFEIGTVFGTEDKKRLAIRFRPTASGQGSNASVFWDR